MGFVFNDLKPDNICVGLYNDKKSLHQLKIIDFGLTTPYLKLDENGREIHVSKSLKHF